LLPDRAKKIAGSGKKKAGQVFIINEHLPGLQFFWSAFGGNDTISLMQGWLKIT
jgi:hypothetical protein